MGPKSLQVLKSLSFKAMTLEKNPASMEQSKNSSYKVDLCPSSVTSSIISTAGFFVLDDASVFVFPSREMDVFNLLPWSLSSHVKKWELEAQLYLWERS